MDGRFMEDLWKGLLLWIGFIAVGAFMLGVGIAVLVMKLA
jgi:hypothetical protein